jgi:putative membrane protein insertion efficiency factor
MKTILLFLLTLYKKMISPFLRPVCRFHPSCSHYASGAIDEWGWLKGSWLATKRVLRCNPWGSYGFDFVPTNDQKQTKDSSTLK